MRKIVSISVILLILLSGVTVNLAFHYCGGMLAEKKVTLTGTAGSCGMEGGEHNTGTGLKSLCCEDYLSSYTFNNIFLPSASKDSATDNEIPVPEFNSILIPAVTSEFTGSEIFSRPPGVYSPTSVQIDLICIFRI